MKKSIEKLMTVKKIEELDDELIKFIKEHIEEHWEELVNKTAEKFYAFYARPESPKGYEERDERVLSCSATFVIKDFVNAGFEGRLTLNEEAIWDLFGDEVNYLYFELVESLCGEEEIDEGD